MAILKELSLSVRPWSFSASIVPSIVGIILVRTDPDHNSTMCLICNTLFTVLLIHAAGNLTNTYCDFINGVDQKYSTHDSTLTDAKLTKNQLLSLLVVCYIASLFSFTFIVVYSPASHLPLIVLYSLGVVSSLIYSSWIALKYRALGDFLTFLTFGPLVTEFSYLSCSGFLSGKAAALVLPMATNAVAILHANNMRDEATDRKAGILTLPMVLGKHISRQLMIALLFSSYIFFLLIIAFTCNLLFVLPALTAPSLVPLYKRVQKFDMIGLPETLAKLHLVQGLLYCFTLLFSNI